MTVLSDAGKRELQLKAARRLLALREAREHLLPFMRLTMPDTSDIDDPTKSKYEVTPQARLLCEIIEKIERGALKRVAVSISPQMGKSQVLTRGGPAWISGRDPTRHIMVGAYNQTFASEFGDDVRTIINSPLYRAVFPEHALRKGATDLLITEQGGKIAFVGVGGSGTGKPADFFFVDDPIRNDEDANSPAYREKLWKWFNRVVFTRCHGDTPILIVHCLAGDTPVTMGDGSRKAIRDIRPGDVVLAWQDGRFSPRRVLNVREQGEDDVFDIRTGSSRVRANARHPFLVERDGRLQWVKVADLTTRDRVLTSGVEQREGARLTADEAWLLGFMFGDGWLTRRDTTQTDKQGRTYPRRGWVTCAAFSGNFELDAQFERCFETTFGFVPKRTRYGYWRTEVQRVGQWFAERGLVGKAKTKQLPTWLFGEAVEVRRAFIGGLLFADGTIDKTHQRVIAGANAQLIQDARHLARSCGIAVSNMHSWRGRVKAPNSKEPIDTEVWSFKWGSAPIVDAFYLKKIRAITPAGREVVYDIQVEGAENFIADGMVVHNTRWHEDDLIGRLCDPDHPERNKSLRGIADDWTYFNIPAIVQDPTLAKALGLTLEVPKELAVVEQFGAKPMAALWPKKFPLKFLAEAKRLDPVGFSALRMGKPSPEEGSYFRAEDIVEYDPQDLPATLRKYGASDHAVSTKQGRDYTVLGCVGIDENDDIWVLPDVVWEQMETDRTVEEMLVQFQTHKPLLWWMESELISKSFGPFLRKRMQEEHTYVTLDPVAVSKDKPTRARSIQGRMRMRKVHFPRFAPWWPQARAQLLRFPAGANDDFVDWLAHIGQGLVKEVAASGERRETGSPHTVGSISWILKESAKRARRDKAANDVRGW